jgi:ABC-type uncharacterized transport system substrate-binding protein
MVADWIGTILVAVRLWLGFVIPGTSLRSTSAQMIKHPADAKPHQVRPAQSDLARESGRNLQIEYRIGAVADADQIRRNVGELVALAPDVILASGGSTIGPLQQATRTVPIVFALVVDPL